MTRETKVGLLVGMGVILLVGIIISDTLTSAQRDTASMTDFAQESQREIRPLDQTAPPDPQPETNTNTRPDRQQPIPDPVPSNAGMLSGVTGQNSSHNRQQNVPDWMRDQTRWRPESEQNTQQNQQNEQPEPSADDNASPSTLTHTVEEGEPLFSIAERYYGNGGRWRELAEHNSDVVGSNGSVRAGVELQIPNTSDLALLDEFEPAGTERTIRVDQPASDENDTDPAGRTITVRSGDNLSSLAREHLGSAGRYRELFEANRDKLSSPDQVAEGMELRLP